MHTLAPHRRLKLAIEVQPTGIPKPTAIAARRESNLSEVVGYLDIEEMRAIIQKWDAMASAYYGPRRQE